MNVIVIVLYLSILTTFSFTMSGAAPCVQIRQLTYQQPLNKLGNIHSQIVFFWFWKKKGTSRYRFLHIRAASTVLRGKTHVDALAYVYRDRLFQGTHTVQWIQHTATAVLEIVEEALRSLRHVRVGNNAEHTKGKTHTDRTARAVSIISLLTNTRSLWKICVCYKYIYIHIYVYCMPERKII